MGCEFLDGFYPGIEQAVICLALTLQHMPLDNFLGPQLRITIALKDFQVQTDRER